ncbi:MAG: hypothetical protein ACREMP_07390 [Candidatus Tyrphobacter sp.]
MLRRIGLLVLLLVIVIVILATLWVERRPVAAFQGKAGPRLKLGPREYVT